MQLETKTAAQARRELQDKLAIENIFTREIRSLFTTINRDFASIFRSTGRMIDFNQYLPDVTAALRRNYSRTQRAFSGLVAEFNDVAISQEQADIIEAGLLAWNEQALQDTPQAIIDTTSNDADTSITQARLSLEEQGAQLDAASVAVAAAVINRRRLIGRTPAIVTTETQAAAESTKLIEAQTISGRTPFSLTPLDIARTRQEPLLEGTKQWVTVADGDVRDTHVAADRQTVPIDSSFNIGGFDMRHPSDKSQGAPVREWIRCRCSAVINIEGL